MQSLTKDDLEEVFSIAREVAKQEIEARLPIHRDIIDLKETIQKLIDAQIRTEERLARLEESMIGVQERVSRLEESMIRFQEAQIGVQERLARLEESMIRFQEAQIGVQERLARLEESMIGVQERVSRLEESMIGVQERLERLEAVVEKLAQAQLRTEERLEDLQKQVGGISHAIGFQLEDRAYRSLPKLLKDDFGIIVREKLFRKFVKTKYNRTIEINILGKAEKDGKELYIAGEAKTNLSARHIDDFTDRLKELEETLQIEVIPIMVTYMTEPEVYEYAKSKGIKVYYSYDFEPIA